jgi:ABC-2 type transport system ATP-binding protein
MRSTDPVISVRNLRKTYGPVEAVRGIDLAVRAGEIFAFLGPNGAGKTSTVEILEGYRRRDAGEVSVLGLDPATPTRAWRERIGIVLQGGRLRPHLTVRESVELFAGYYPRPRPVDETIELVGLGSQRSARTERLSGGQQRRLDVALALVGDPELLFLDEPTTGLDPAARRNTWRVISGLRELGKTVLLTTHYMDEAQELADRVAIINAGEIVAHGPPEELGGRDTAPVEIRFRVPDGVGPDQLPSGLPGDVEISDGRAVLRTHEPVPALNALTSWALERGHDLPALEVERPSLEDIYLQLTESRDE